MRIVFIGDVVGKTGRRVVARAMPEIRRAHAPDLIIANAENSAGGSGIDAKGLEELESAGVRFFTTGNHVWDKRDGIELLNAKDNIVRPGNYPPGSPGRGAALVPGMEGRVVVLNAQGRVFMPPLDCPFRWIDAYLESDAARARVVIVDFHGEATSEKIAMGHHLDGRASLVLGTHTHVATRDACLLPGGTGYVTDVGMSGSFDSILGVEKSPVIERFLSMRPIRFGVAKGDPRCDYVVSDVDEATGRATRIEHHQWREGAPAADGPEEA